MEPASKTRKSSNTNASEKKAGWLHSPFEADVWVVSDSFDHTKKEEIDFRVILPDGRLLNEASQYYLAIKSYAWWVRSDRFTGIESAATHANTVRLLIALAHRLCLDGIRTFSHLVPSDIEKIVEDAVFGIDAVVRASERLDEYLQVLKGLGKDEKDELAKRILNDSPWSPQRVSPIKVLALCNLPRSLHTSGRVSFRVNQIAKLLGVTPTDNGKDSTRKVTSREAVQRFLLPLERLYLMRSVIEGGGLLYNPFPEGVGTLAKTKGLDPQRTPLPAPMLVLELLEEAVLCVADYRGGRSKTYDDMIVTACWILIAAFSSRRKEEILGLEDDCIKGSEAGGWYIECYINKTLQHRSYIPVLNSPAFCRHLQG